MEIPEQPDGALPLMRRPVIKTYAPSFTNSVQFYQFMREDIPLLAEEGRTRPQKNAAKHPSKERTGWSDRRKRGSAGLQLRLRPSLEAARYRACASRGLALRATPSARAKGRFAAYFLTAQPPLCEEGIIPRKPRLPIFELSHYQIPFDARDGMWVI